ncbi:Exosome RNA helicase MTR4, partial [Sarracenia purpurea var. burkii]
TITVDVMVPMCKSEHSQAHEMEVISIRHNQIVDIGAVRLTCPKDLRSSDNQKAVSKSLQETKKRFAEIPLLDPINDMNIQVNGLKVAIQNLQALQTKLESMPIHQSSDIDELCKQYDEKFKISEEIENTIAEFKKLNKVDQLVELKRHKKVLKKLNYCSAAEVVETKGKIACELSSGEELLMTELIFNGIFSELNPAQCVALLSCFMCDEKSNTQIQMTDELSGSLRRMQELARMIARVSKECHVDIDEDSYVDKFKPYLMDVCHAWCNGSSFMEVCRKTDIFEGSIIRSFRRMEEALRQLVQATRSIGNSELEKKFNESIVALKRGIAFAASLYL